MRTCTRVAGFGTMASVTKSWQAYAKLAHEIVEAMRTLELGRPAHSASVGARSCVSISDKKRKETRISFMSMSTSMNKICTDCVEYSTRYTVVLLHVHCTLALYTFFFEKSKNLWGFSNGITVLYIAVLCT